MKKGTTLLLKIAVFLIGTPILALCIYGLLLLVGNPVNSNYVHILYPIIIGLYVTVIPFYYALYHAFNLLIYIDKNEAFSELSVKALTKIKYCAFTISTVYVVIFPFIYTLAEKDDATGVILIGMVIIFTSIVIAFFAAVLQRLFIEAIDIKSENDLTV
ncbi:hypothetical protein BKP45_02785 [Anaerobacillus alkalidiazotrophicus]|uniref:DUF2975 domain-containing protein n=1 Tax=Anaerobacillus alkalidiazotrophicus TaxID=472963 RepID=A0A1S2MAR4_9BACI|nr:DUF2975 domain-containing protein [Anaerobacillus alkalidiazotrophicus]OIJ21666.1 hypothetical protein BKP45_02785 [Anaerobacillus alkalidiazotrophicus]